MADTVAKTVRSRIMASVGRKDTKPELIVRSLLHRKGYRFRLQSKKLPGTPDIILPRYHAAIFVHGCFWHQHRDCPFSKRPGSNTDYWDVKLNENIKRDENVRAKLHRLGWKVLIIWECETNNDQRIQKRIDSLVRDRSSKSNNSV